MHVLGVGEAHWHRHVSSMPDLTVTAASESGPRAFAEAGLTPADVQCAQLYDAFTITPILFLEDLGFVAKGEGGAFVADGHIAPGGSLPVNTNGGGLSYGHPGMYGAMLMVEAVRQVREGGMDVVLAHGNGGVMSSECTALLGSDAVRLGSRRVDFELTDEQQLIKSTAREFADKEIVPVAGENSRNHHFDTDLVQKIADQGYLGRDRADASTAARAWTTSPTR